jgi:hypothetical protein
MKLIYPAALIVSVLVFGPVVMLMGSCKDTTVHVPLDKVTLTKNVIYGEDIGPVSVVCIDGVQYLATVTALVPRYTIDAEGDPYVGTCVNR